MGIFDRFRSPKQQQEGGDSELLSNVHAADSVSPTLGLSDVHPVGGDVAKPFGGEMLGQEDRDRLYNPYEGESCLVWDLKH